MTKDILTTKITKVTKSSDIIDRKLRATMVESFRGLRKFFADSKLLNQQENTMSPRSARLVARRPRRPNGFGPQGEGHEGSENYYISISSFVLFATFVVIMSVSILVAGAAALGSSWPSW